MPQKWDRGNRALRVVSNSIVKACVGAREGRSTAVPPLPRETSIAPTLKSYDKHSKQIRRTSTTIIVVHHHWHPSNGRNNNDDDDEDEDDDGDGDGDDRTFQRAIQYNWDNPRCWVFCFTIKVYSGFKFSSKVLAEGDNQCFRDLLLSFVPKSGGEFGGPRKNKRNNSFKNEPWEEVERKCLPEFCSLRLD